MYCTDKFPLMWVLLLPSDLHRQLAACLRTRQRCVIFIFPAFLFWRNRLISPERHTDPSQQILWFWNLPEMSGFSLRSELFKLRSWNSKHPRNVIATLLSTKLLCRFVGLANFLFLRCICRPNSRYIMKFRAKRCLILLTLFTFM